MLKNKLKILCIGAVVLLSVICFSSTVSADEMERLETKNGDNFHISGVLLEDGYSITYEIYDEHAYLDVWYFEFPFGSIHVGEWKINLNDIAYVDEGTFYLNMVLEYLHQSNLKIEI